MKVGTLNSAVLLAFSCRSMNHLLLVFVPCPKMRSLIVISILFAIQCVTAQNNNTVDPANVFIRPPVSGPPVSIDESVYLDNQAYTLNEKQNLPWTWKATEKIALVLYQEGNPSNVKRLTLIGWFFKARLDFNNPNTVLECPSDKHNYYWNGTLPGIDLSVSNVFFLAVVNCSAPGFRPWFYSHYFNITQPVVSTSTGPSLTNSTSNTSPLIGGNSNSGGNNGNVSAAIGGGVGGGIGGAILLVGIGCLIFFWKRGKKKDEEKLSQRLQQQQQQFLPYQNGPRELSGNSSVHHLSYPSSHPAELPNHFGSGSHAGPSGRTDLAFEREIR